MIPVLRPYQSDGKILIRSAFGRGHRCVLYVLSTGGGKTTIFASIAADAATKGNRVLILCHRIELLDQISGALEALGVAHGFIAAGYPGDVWQTMIASVQTLVRRLDSIPEPQLIIVDECHHARSATFETILGRWPKAKILGVTATPVRQSGEGLGTIFEIKIEGPGMADLMDQGYLARYRLFSPPTASGESLHTRAGDYIASEIEELMNKPSITGSALSHYKQHADGLPALAFCASVKHSAAVAEQFRDAGYSAVTLHGALDKEIRRGIVKDFRQGRIQVITACDVISEGFDVPGAHCGIFLRHTQSIGLYLQQIGRILRPCEGKSHAILLDHVGNAMRHGLPDEPREWSLDGEDRKTKPKAASVRICPKCWCALPGASRTCSQCGYEFPVESRKIEERDGELKELTPAEYAEIAAKRAVRQEQGRADTLEALREHGRKLGRAPGWADHVWAARQKKRSASQSRD